jgi:cobalt-zinc-cadmium efflux system membrane fusion protein
MASVIAACAVYFGGCSRESKVNAGAPNKTEAVKVDESPDVNVIKVDHPEQFPLVSVQTRATANELQTNGVVSPDVSRAVPVNALVSGRAVDLKARLGDTVTKGQLLLTINSADLAMAFADYQKFQADEVLAKKDLERKQLLYSKGAVPQKDVEASEDAAQKAAVDRKTAADRIRILGGDPDHIASMFEVRAPVSGTITEQNVTVSAGVKSPDNSPNLFTISDLSHVWVLCDVYENNLSQVRLGDHARVQLNAYPDRPLQGRISNISRILDPATRTAKVRLDLENRAGLLRPGMFATITFYSQSKLQRAVVPASAVLRLHDKDWVFRPDGDKRFRRVEIHTGASVGDGLQEVTSGLSPGDRVVANPLQLSGVADQS